MTPSDLEARYIHPMQVVATTRLGPLLDPCIPSLQAVLRRHRAGQKDARDSAGMTQSWFESWFEQ